MHFSAHKSSVVKSRIAFHVEKVLIEKTLFSWGLLNGGRSHDYNVSAKLYNPLANGRKASEMIFHFSTQKMEYSKIAKNIFW